MPSYNSIVSEYSINSQKLKKVYKEEFGVGYNIELTKDISELIGAIIGDGNIYRDKYIEICGNKKLDHNYFTERLLPIIKSELGYDARLFYHQGALRFRICNKKFILWLKELGLPTGKGKHLVVKIPQQILASEENIKYCIRGIFDTDGFIYWDKRQIYKNPYPRLGITTCSKRLFNQLVEVLERLEFEGIYKKQYAKRGAYDVELYGHANLRKWMTVIGSSNKKNLDKIMPL